MECLSRRAEASTYVANMMLITAPTWLNDHHAFELRDLCASSKLWRHTWQQLRQAIFGNLFIAPPNMYIAPCDMLHRLLKYIPIVYDDRNLDTPYPYPGWNIPRSSERCEARSTRQSTNLSTIAFGCRSRGSEWEFQDPLNRRQASCPSMGSYLELWE